MNKTCPCGNISIEWDTQLRDLIARRCGCTYCQSQQAEYASDHHSTLRIKIANTKHHHIEQHGYNTAEFHECSNCGLVFVSSVIEQQRYGVINLKNLSDVDYSLDPIVRNFEAETVNERLQRRQANWYKLILEKPDSPLADG